MDTQVENHIIGFLAINGYFVANPNPNRSVFNFSITASLRYIAGH